MIDTIRIRSPFLTEEQTNILYNNAILKITTDISSGEVFYKFTNIELKGSFDNNIYINLKNREYYSIINDKRNSREIIESISEPYLIIEFSLHKFLKGHNLFDGTDNLEDIQLFLDYFMETFNISLPYYNNWYIERIDYSENFNLFNKENCLNYLKSLNNLYYPKRIVNKYKTSIYCSSRNTTLKIYHKGTEFLKHDKKRLENILNQKYTPDIALEELNFLSELADKIIRFEIEVRKRKILYDFKKMGIITDKEKLIKIIDLDINYIKKLYKDEFIKLLKLGDEMNKVFFNDESVLLYLNQKYSKRNLGKSVFSTYIMIKKLGYEFAKNSISSSTFYRHYEILQKEGIKFNDDIEFKIIPDTQFSFNPFIDTRLKVI